MTINFMFAYNQFSEGGKELAKALDIPRIKHSGSTFKGSGSKVVLNWGTSMERLQQAGVDREILKCRVLNHPNKVDIATDKVLSFEAFQRAGVSIPDFTTNKATALQWVEEGRMVFARKQLSAHSGRGIHIMDPDHPDTWEVSAPLYVKYIPKKDEYRIHVVRGEIIDVQRKGLREELKGTEGVNFKVRNLANGFVFVRNDGRTVPQCVLDVGRQAVQALELDFGAADVIYNAQASRAYALEVNSAPGIMGTTLTNYTNALRGL